MKPRKTFRKRLRPGMGMLAGLTDPTEAAFSIPRECLFFINTEETPAGRDYDNALNFCRCFAKEENWRILRALAWDIPKSAVELAAETGLEAAAVEKALAEDFGNIVSSRYILGQPRWSVYGWVKPLLHIMGYY